MPKRTNEFQTLVLRIEELLHIRTGALIEESEELPNAASGALEEVDVVITLEAGGRTYRTGIQARAHARKGGPAWIRDLALQRKQCGLDRIVAAHSKGFTKRAVRMAAVEQVELIDVCTTTEQMHMKLFPVDGVRMQHVHGEPLVVRVWNSGPDDVLARDRVSMLEIPGFSPMMLMEAQRRAVNCCERIVEGVLRLDDPKLASESCVRVIATAVLPRGSVAIHESGGRRPAAQLTMQTDVHTIHVVFGRPSAVAYGKHSFLSAKAQVTEGTAELLCTPSPERPGAFNVTARVPMRAMEPTRTLHESVSIDDLLLDREV